jgi:hypothetical protein
MGGMGILNCCQGFASTYSPPGNGSRTNLLFISPLVLYCNVRRLGGVVVSMFATRPKDRGLKHGQGDGFLRMIKICSRPSDGK